MDVRYSGPEVARLLDSPAILTDLPDGTYRVEKAGVVATAPTPTEALAEWARRFAAMIARPNSS
jgi:hypothetical protein